MDVLKDYGHYSGQMRPGRVGALILTIVGFVSVAIFGVMIDTLRTAYTDVEVRAEREAQGLLEASVSYLRSQMALWNLTLRLATDVVEDERFGTASRTEKDKLLANLAATAGSIGSLLVLNAQGDIIFDPLSAPPRSGNFSDRDYFLVHQATDIGVYVSQPYRSRLRDEDPSIAMSTRVSGPNGAFEGVVVVAVRLTAIAEMFSTLDPGARGMIAVINAAGKVLVRQPSLDGRGDVELDLSKSPNFRRMKLEQSGTFSAVAVTDGIDRLYAFTTVPGTDLNVSVGLSRANIFEGWYRRLYITVAIMITMCGLAMLVTMRLRRELSRREAAEAQLAQLARTDPLTGLANRRVFEEVAEREMRRARRTGRQLPLLLIDVDHFKRVNDQHGHAVGDVVLKLLSQIMLTHLRRPGDLCVRYGGEEFLALLADTSVDGAVELANKIRRNFERQTALMPELAGACTLSIGIASLNPAITTAADLFSAADRALYRAKDEGRNRVVCP